MANAIGANPWKLDTASTTAVYNFPIKIENLVWANYTTAGDILLIRDINGYDIIDAVVPATVTPFWSFGKIGWVRGLVLVTISHGEVTIAIGAGK